MPRSARCGSLVLTNFRSCVPTNLVVRVGVVFAAVLAVVAATARPTPAQESAGSCGSAYRALKTLSDRQRTLVNLQPKDTTLIAIARRQRPKATPARASSAFERRVWRLSAQITDVKLADDGGIKLVLFDAGSYGIAEMPAPACVPKTARARRAIVNARQQYVGACGQPSKQWQPLGAVVLISGVGFWDQPYIPIKQHAPNFAELHPVTGLTIIAGCK